MNIWNEYQKRNPGEYFDEDGIVDKSTYTRQRIKPLFILKETDELNGSLREFLAEGAPGGGRYTWQPACKWIEALLNGTMNGNYRTAQERQKMLRRVATMNLKKTSGGAISTRAYVNWASKNADILQKQINQINPDVIICCCDGFGNNFIYNSLLRISPEYYDKKSGLYYGIWKGKKVIYARHPLFSSSDWIQSFADFRRLI